MKTGAEQPTGFGRVVRPVISESDCPEGRYWIRGSSVLLVIADRFQCHSPVPIDDSHVLTTALAVLPARYAGPSGFAHCHTAELPESLPLTHLDGLSGGAVFSTARREGNGEAGRDPVMVGIMLRGTAESRRVHFLSATVISRFIQLADGPLHTVCGAPGSTSRRVQGDTRIHASPSRASTPGAWAR